jgi:hypothetical protein
MSEGSQLLPLFPALLAALLALFAPLCPIWHLAPSCTCTSGAPYPLPLLAAKAGPPPCIIFCPPTAVLPLLWSLHRIRHLLPLMASALPVPHIAPTTITRYIVLVFLCSRCPLPITLLVHHYCKNRRQPRISGFPK